MKQFHATITFAATSDEAAEKLRQKLEELVSNARAEMNAEIELDFQEEISFMRREVADAEEDATAELAFDDIFVPKSDSF